MKSGGVVLTTGPSPDPRAADLDLIRRVVDRDEGALAALYDRYSGLVYAVAKRVLQDTGAAEEILQDIFYQLWRTAGSFDASRGTLPGWLLVTARNRAIDRLRRRVTADRAVTEEAPASFPFALETAAFRNQMISRMKAALDGLPEAQRLVMEMAYFEGLTQSEIAERTSEPLGTVKTRMRTALQTLKRALKA
jgi:RNA polymerase sigma-70 factor (ECF subfamily)